MGTLKTEFALMPKHFLSPEAERGTPLEGRIELDFKLVENTSLAMAIGRVPLILSIWVANMHSSVVRLLVRPGGIFKEIISGDPKGETGVFLRGSSKPISSLFLAPKEDSVYPPTVVARLHARVPKRDETEEAATGWLEVGTAVFLEEEAQFINYHYLTSQCLEDTDRCVVATATCKWSQAKKDEKARRESALLVTRIPKYPDPTATFPTPTTAIRKCSRTRGKDKSAYHPNNYMLVVAHDQKHLSEISHMVRLQQRIRSIYRNDIIGFGYGAMPREAFYAMCKTRFQLDLVWAECLLEYMVHVFGGKEEFAGATLSLGDSFGVKTGKGDQRLRDLFLMGLVMFVSRLGYQEDAMKVGTFEEAIETFSQGCLTWGGGDCEDLSWTLWAFLIHLQDAKADTTSYPWLCEFQRVFKGYRPHACLVEASAPQFRITKQNMQAVAENSNNNSPDDPADIPSLEESVKKGGFLHMVTLMIPDAVYGGDKAQGCRNILTTEGTSSTYVRLFGEEGAAIGKMSVEEYQKLMYNLLVKLQAEPLACIVNDVILSPEQKEFLPHMYQVLIGGFTYRDGHLVEVQFGTKAEDGTVVACTEVNKVATHPDKFVAEELEVLDIDKEMMRDVEMVLSLEPPPPRLTINKNDFKRELQLLKRRPTSDLFTGYYKQSTTPMPFLPWNMTDMTAGQVVKPWYLEFVTS